MGVVETTSHDCDNNARAVEAALVHLENVGQKVAVVPLEFRACHDGRVIVIGAEGRVASRGGQAVDLYGPDAGNLAKGLDVDDRLGRSVGEVEGRAVEDVRGEVQTRLDIHNNLLDGIVESIGVVGKVRRSKIFGRKEAHLKAISLVELGRSSTRYLDNVPRRCQEGGRIGLVRQG